RLHLVGKQDGDELGTGDRLRDRADGQPGVFRKGPRLAALPEPDLDLDAGVVQVEGMRVSLAAVADHGHLAGEQGDIAFSEDGRHRWFLSFAGRSAGEVTDYRKTVRRRRCSRGT